MKIESVDNASYAKAVKGSNSTSDKRVERAEVAAQNKNAEVKKQNVTEREEISDKMVIDAIEKANQAIKSVYREFQFSIHEATKQISIKVLDTETKEVIREIPPEKVLDMVAKMWEMAGIMVDERR